jgi:hypothetical protein
VTFTNPLESVAYMIKLADELKYEVKRSSKSIIVCEVVLMLIVRGVIFLGINRGCNSKQDSQFERHTPVLLHYGRIPGISRNRLVRLSTATGLDYSGGFWSQF